MKKLFVLLVIISAPIIFFSFTGTNVGSANAFTINDSLEADRAKYIAIINERIKGKEKMQVDSVFTDLKVLGGFPAEILPRAMNSWSQALGVSCGHCHNTDNFSSDEKEKKLIAREMVTMGNMISQKLKTIQGISDRPIVNCTTCHRGELKPAFKMPTK